MDVPRDIRPVGAPFARARRLGGIGDVHDIDRAGPVVGDEDVAAVLGMLVDVDRVHARGHAVHELGDLLRVQRVAGVGDHDAVLPVGRALPGEDHVVAVGGGLHVVHQAGIRLEGIHHDRPARIADVERIDPVAAAVGAEIGHLAVGMDPHLRGQECRARQASDHGHRPPHVPLRDIHRGAGRAAAEHRRHRVGAGAIRDEAAVGTELPVAGREGPGGCESRDRLAAGVAGVHLERHHVTLPYVGPRRAERQLRDVGRVDLHLEGGGSAAHGRGDPPPPRRHTGDHPVPIHGEHLGIARAPGDRVTGTIVGLGVGDRADPDGLAAHDAERGW